MVTIEGVRGNKLIFTVPLPDREPVFMVAELSPIYGVIVVDAEKLHKLWKNEPNSIHGEQSHGNSDSWKNDRKYVYADVGFSAGYDNPVPLPEVGYWADYPCISFVDGVTRTIWLLSKGCKSFPIMCEIENAQELHKVVSVFGTELITCNNQMTGVEEDSASILLRGK